MATKKKAAEVSREPIVTEWCGAPRYECPVCGRDSDSKSTIDDHIAGHFPVIEEGTDGTATVDQDGVHGTISDSGVNVDDDRGGRNEPHSGGDHG